MTVATVENELKIAPMAGSVAIFNAPEGRVFGWGTTVGNGIEGWAPGALFVDTDSSAGTVYVNSGSKTSASFAAVNGLVETDRGTKTQTGNKVTTLTLNNRSGAITMHGAALAAGAEVDFTVTNSTIAATDVIAVCIGSGVTTPRTYNVGVGRVADGAFDIYLGNVSDGQLSEAVVVNFVAIATV